MRSRRRLVVVGLLFPLLVCLFLSVGFSTAQVDSSILSMSGSGWSVKVDGSLSVELASKNSPFVSVSKGGAEKELF